MFRHTHTRTEVKTSDLKPSDELVGIVVGWVKNQDTGRVDAAVMSSITQPPPDEWSALANFYREVEQ